MQTQPTTAPAEVTMPVTKFSYSSLTQLLRNPLIWKLKYALGIYTSKAGVSAMVGRAGHQALRFYYGGDPDRPTPSDRNAARAEAIQIGLEYLDNTQDIYIEYGKTGSREDMLKSYTKAMSFYFAEEPEYGDILMTEEKMEAELTTYQGQKLGIPATGIPDLVVKDGEAIDIVDTKFVKTFTDYDKEDYIKIVQAMFLWHLLRGSKGLTARRVVFREIKYTENKDKSVPQIRDYVIPCDHEQYHIIFMNLYSDCVRFISNPNAIYLPNLSDTFDGEQAGMLYAQGLITSDMSDVEVMHKVKDVALVSKKFVASRLDAVENQYLPPQEKIAMRLGEFGIPVIPVEPIVGASVTQYRFKVSRGVRMATILKHNADIARAIEAESELKILAPIPGTDMLGVEVANKERTGLLLTAKELTKGTMLIPVGQTVGGETAKIDLQEAPHLLIAGSTGSGKSVLLSAILTALTKQTKPDDMRLVLIDPKRVELTHFAKSKHLHGNGIVYEYKEAMATLDAISKLMDDRFKRLEKAKARNLTEYNATMKKGDPMQSVVVVVDEYADLITQGKHQEKKKKNKQSIERAADRASVEVIARQYAKQGLRYKPSVDDSDTMTAEELIARIAAMGRAVGIHLIIATQRPSVDVITGLIKANFPTRIALRTASAVDSKVIIDEAGAEKLAGKGDMILISPTRPGATRLQGFITN